MIVDETLISEAAKDAFVLSENLKEMGMRNTIGKSVEERIKIYTDYWTVKAKHIEALRILDDAVNGRIGRMSHDRNKHNGL